MSTEVRSKLVGDNAHSKNNGVDVLDWQFKSVNTCAVWWRRNSDWWMAIDTASQTMQLFAHRAEAPGKHRELHCSDVGKMRNAQTLQQRDHAPINLCKVGKHCNWQLRQALLTSADIHHMPSTDSCCVARRYVCCKTTVGHTHTERSDTGIAHADKNMFHHCVQPLCKRCVATDIS
jgi:hypothetical protein